MADSDLGFHGKRAGGRAPRAGMGGGAAFQGGAAPSGASFGGVGQGVTRGSFPSSGHTDGAPPLSKAQRMQLDYKRTQANQQFKPPAHAVQQQQRVTQSYVPPMQQQQQPESAPTAIQSLRDLRKQAEAQNSAVSKARIAQQTAENRRVTEKVDEFGTRLSTFTETLNEVSEAVAQLYAQNGDGGASSENARQADLDELVKIVMSQQETIRDLTDRIENFAAGPPVELNDEKAEELVKALVTKESVVIRQTAKDVENSANLASSKATERVDTLKSQVDALANAITEATKDRERLQKELQGALNIIHDATFFMFGTVLSDLAVYENIPKSTDDTLEPKTRLTAGTRILMVNPLEDTDTGTWIKVRDVNELGEMSQGWAPVSACERYIKADTTLTHVAEEDDHVEAIGEFVTIPNTTTTE